MVHGMWCDVVPKSVEGEKTKRRPNLDSDWPSD